jgi:hypothetical protein
MEQIRDSVQAAFDADLPEPGALREDSRRIEERLIAMLPDGSRIDAYECRTSWCRVATTHTEFHAYLEFASKIIKPAPDFERGPSLTDVLTSEPGRVVAIAYIGRGDVEFPAITASADHIIRP